MKGINKNNIYIVSHFIYYTLQGNAFNAKRKMAENRGLTRTLVFVKVSPLIFSPFNIIKDDVLEPISRHQTIITEK